MNEEELVRKVLKENGESNECIEDIISSEEYTIFDLRKIPDKFCRRKYMVLEYYNIPECVINYVEFEDFYWDKFHYDWLETDDGIFLRY